MATPQIKFSILSPSFNNNASGGLENLTEGESASGLIRPSPSVSGLNRPSPFFNNNAFGEVDDVTFCPNEVRENCMLRGKREGKRWYVHGTRGP